MGRSLLFELFSEKLGVKKNDWLEENEPTIFGGRTNNHIWKTEVKNIIVWVPLRQQLFRAIK